MKIIKDKRLLKRQAVIEEIERFRWIESEKRGYDIGFNKAADHWIVFYALAWLKYHSSESKTYTLRPDLRRYLNDKRTRS